MDTAIERPQRGGQPEIRTARKSYRCCECDQSITLDQRYEYVRGCWETRWYTFRTCLGCRAVRRSAAVTCWAFCQLWDMRDAAQVSLWPRREETP